MPDKRTDIGHGHDHTLISLPVPGRIILGNHSDTHGLQLGAARPLGRRVLERYLSLMRDVGGATLDAQLLRGRQAGGVILSLTLKRKRIDGSLSYDNVANQYMGTGQLNAQFSLNSFLRDGDETKINVLVARDFHSFVYAALSHATPLGSSGLKLNLSGAWLQTRVDSLNLRGSAQAAGVSLSYPLIRGYKRNLTVSIGVDGLNSDSALFGSTASSDHIRAARLAAGYSMTGNKAVFSAGATVSKGLGGHGDLCLHRPCLAADQCSSGHAGGSLRSGLSRRGIRLAYGGRASVSVEAAKAVPPSTGLWTIGG
jgi:hemolysin activation/secretion protein